MKKCLDRIGGRLDRLCTRSIPECDGREKHRTLGRSNAFINVGILVVLGLFSTGCVSSNYKMIPEAKRQPPVELGLLSASSNLRVDLHSVIYYDGPGSWKAMADWDEYVFSVRNLSDAPTELSAITHIGPRGEAIESGADPWLLVKRTGTLQKELKKDGILVSKSVDPALLAGAVAVEAGIFVGAAAATEAVFVAALGGSALAAGAIIALPAVALVAAPVYIISNGRNKRAVEAEFERRRLRFPYVLESKSTISGSVFFPIVPSPRSLQIISEESVGSPVQEPLVLHLADSAFEKLHVAFDE